MSIYPKIARNVMLPLADIVASTNISRNLKFLEKSQWWSREELQEYQNKKLRALITHAYENVPYYHREWKKLRLNPENIKTVEDLRKIPIITKEDVRKNFEDFKSKDFADRKPKLDSTGGSTGEPLKFYYDWSAWSMDWACFYRGWGFAGYNVGDKIVTIGGSSLVPSQKPSFQKQVKNRIIERHIGLSAFDMNEKNMKIYAEQIAKFKPRFLRGYASSLYIFAKFVDDNNIKNHPLCNIVSTAETLFEPYREKIESAFGVKVFNEYGTRDGGGNALECDMHSGWHISAERCVMEFIKDGENVSSGEKGKIILTDLHNYSFPFIRYDVGDIGIQTVDKCPCGRGLPMVKKIEGRVIDFITTHSGKLLPGEFFPHLLGNFLFIKEYQIIQENRNNLTIRAVIEKDLNYMDDINKVKDIIRQHIGDGMKVHFEFVSEIPLTKSGKRRFIISKVKPEL